MSTRPRSRAPRSAHPGPRAFVSALGYADVPATGGRSELRSQQAEINQACRLLGLRLLDVVPAQRPFNGDAAERPGLERVLERLEAGEASCLVVCRLEQLSPRVDGLASVIDRLERAGARLVVLDVGLDTASSTGRLALERRPVARAGEGVYARDGVDARGSDALAAEPTPSEPLEDAMAELVTAEAAPAEPVEPAVEPAEHPGAEAAAAEPVAAEPLELPAAPEPAAVEPAEHPGAEPAAAEPVESSAESVSAEPAATQPAEESPPPEAPADAPVAVATRALGYATLPAQHGGESEELQRQLAAIESRTAELGIDLVDVIREREVEGRALERPGLSLVTERIAAGAANCLVVESLGRLSRSLAEVGKIVSWLDRNDIRLVAVDLELDTATQAGRVTARALTSVAGWERERLSERTRAGLEAARAKRRAVTEAPAAGASSAAWPEVSKRIAAMRADGMTLQAIADQLNAEGVPTPRGGMKWRPSSVQTAAGYKRRNRAKEELPAVEPPPGDASAPGPRRSTLT